MQLRFTPPLSVKAVGFKFNPSVTAILSGVTVAGTFTAAALNSELARTSITNSLDPVKQFLTDSYLYDGVKQVITTLKDWGLTVISTKDDFKSWIERYLGADGLKSGVVQLSEKLQAWSLIVYNWFKDKFIEFIKNIPRMVQEWDKLRLSLFKWGTFLGGGGGSALWAMFGSGANWDKLGELMAREDFAEIAENLGKLMEDNHEVFENMESEEVQEILEKFLYETDEAKEATKDLLKQQEEKKKTAEEEAKKAPEKQDEEKKQEKLTEEEIKKAFSPPSGGSPKTMAQAFGSMVALGLNKVADLQNSFFSDESPRAAARKGMENYIKLLEKDIEQENKRNRKDSIKKQFIETIAKDKEKFINTLSSVAEKASDSLKIRGVELTQENLVNEFLSSFEKEFTTEAGEGQEGDYNIDKEIFKLSEKR